MDACRAAPCWMEPLNIAPKSALRSSLVKIGLIWAATSRKTKASRTTGSSATRRCSKVRMMPHCFANSLIRFVGDFANAWCMVDGWGSPDVASCHDAQLARFIASEHVLETGDVGLSNEPLPGSSATRCVTRRSKSAVFVRNLGFIGSKKWRHRNTY